MKILVKYHSLRMLRTMRLWEFIEDVQNRTGKSVELCLVEMGVEEKRSVEVDKSGFTAIQRRAIVCVEGERHPEFDEMLNRLP